MHRLHHPTPKPRLKLYCQSSRCDFTERATPPLTTFPHPQTDRLTSRNFIAVDKHEWLTRYL